MKRILMAIVAAVVLTVNSTGVLAAGSANIEVKNDRKSVSYSYSELNTNETVRPITDFLYVVKDITKLKPEATQVLTVKSNTNLGGNIDFTLRMTDKKDYTDKQVNADESLLNYYDVKIKDSNGNLISSTKNDLSDITKNDDGEFIKNLDLGTFNSQFSTETKVYNIEVSVPASASEKNLNEAKENIEWSLVSVPKKRDNANQSDSSNQSSGTQTATQAPSNVTPGPTSAATTPTPKPADEQKNAKGIKYVGVNKDIVPGRYVVTGNGSVKVYNSANELKTNIPLTDGKSAAPDPKSTGNPANGKSDPEGIESYVLNLAEGDRVEISDYINLKPYSSASPTPKATTKPAATTRPATTVKATTAPKKATTAAKTNPKTGDTMPVMIISIIAILALGACVFIEISKRKKN